MKTIRTELITARIRSKAPTWLLLAGAVSPAFVAFVIQKKHWINIPIWDEWDTPGIALLHFAQRTLTWGDLVAQHNESRKVVPRLIHIAIASVAGWDVRQGMVLTFLCACAVSAWALAFLRRRPNHSPSQVLLPWLLINIFLFAPSQYENFLSGFVFEIFIPFLCLLGCCAVNLSRWPLWAKVVCNSFLALLSTYTFAHGMLLWAFAIPIPIREERSRKPRFFLVWYAAYFAIGILSVAYYFAGYKRPEIAPPPATLAQLPQVLEFIFVWLGAVVRSPFVNARFSGALVSLVIAASLIGAFAVLRKNKERWPLYYPWLLLLGFALSSGLVTAVGRVNIGVDNVFNTWFDGFSGLRYNVTSVFAYVALIGLVFNLYEDRIRFQPLLRNRFRTGLTVCYTLLAVAWTEMLADESARVKQFQANRKRARTAVIWINALPENPEIFAAYPYPDGFAPRVEEMRVAGLVKQPKVSDSLRQTIGTAPGAADSGAGFLDLGEARPNGRIRFAGWARNPVKQAGADYVVLGWQGPGDSFHPFTAIRTGHDRPDVAEVCGPRLLKAGFDEEIDISKLPAGTVTIKGWAIDWQTQHAFPLKGGVQLDRPRS
ncbi:MAG: hypothetical protein M3N48_00915 [Verrucomicrobiota bacterium]|nr:hypothetical protein [Verrucomicrobiota bacterium]